MDAKKALYRSKLKEAAAQKRDKRIDSPLVRYNEYDQPICRVCDVVLKSESLWAAHQASRKHHEAITNYKATAAGRKQNIVKSEPPTELVHKMPSSSTLPADFFDKNHSKGQKNGLGTRDKIVVGTPNASVKAVDSFSSGRIHGKTEGFAPTPVEPFASGSDTHELSGVHAVNAKGSSEGIPSNQLSHTTRKSSESESSQVRGAVPEGFFDQKDVKATRKMGVSEVKRGNGAVPEGFFDNKDARTTTNLDGSGVQQVKGSLPEGFFDKDDAHTKRKMDGSEGKQAKGALPEGFFDNKDADLRARGIEPVKIDIKDEYKEFEKLIQEDLQEVDERLEEEEIDAAEMIEGEETLEQKAYREKVEMLKKKQLELKAARFGRQKGSKLRKDSSDEDSSSDEDDDEENFAVDWRAKHL